MSIIGSPRRERLQSALCAAAVLTLAGLAACSAGTNPTSPPSGGAASAAASAGTRGPSDWRRHPCALLTGAEASAVLGQRVSALENIQGEICEYISAGLSAGNAFAATWAGDWRICKRTLGPGLKRLVPVGGIGDDALWVAGTGHLCVRSGSIGLLVIVGGPKISQLPDHGLAKAETLARLSLPRL